MVASVDSRAVAELLITALHSPSLVGLFAHEDFRSFQGELRIGANASNGPSGTILHGEYPLACLAVTLKNARPCGHELLGSNDSV
jgi:hypothetical protein